MKNSNFTEVLEYVQGDISSPPKGFSFLFNRLSKDPLVKEMIKETRGETSTEESSGSQSGSGKRRKKVLVKVLPIKRKNKFVPQIWEKL